MSREIIDLTGLDGFEDTTFVKSARLVLPNPRHGGPSLLEIRQALGGKGRLRISGTQARIFVDVDPGELEAPLVALETIARDDASGLERMLLSVLPHVDEIVLGIDGRSQPETLKIARAYADEVHVFEADDIGVSPDEWAANRIDFAKARNIGRARVQAPWTLVLDTDEFFVLGADDVRAKVKAATDAVGSFAPDVVIGSGIFNDVHRLARTKYRWEKGTHNQLVRDRGPAPIDFKIYSDTSLRTVDEAKRRNDQRDRGIDELIEDAAKGDLTALFHLAKHRSGGTPEELAEAVRLSEDYRSRIMPHDEHLSDERAWIALGLAFRFYQEDNLDEADRWACRVLLDGPHSTAFCLLGDIAEDQGDLARARRWYQAACAIDEIGKIKWPGITELRFGRLAGIERALADPSSATTMEEVFDDDGHLRPTLEVVPVDRATMKDTIDRIVGAESIRVATVSTAHTAADEILDAVDSAPDR